MLQRSWMYFILVFSGLCTALSAQDIQFNGRTKQVVAVGETFNLIYSVNAAGTNFQGPKLQAFSILSGPNTSSSSSIQIINGQTRSSVEYSFTYYLQAQKEGTFEIPPARIMVNGKQYSSNALSLKVVKGSAGSQGQSAQGQSRGSGGQSGYSASDVLIKAFVSNASPVQGEVVVVSYKLYDRINVYSMDGEPKFPGFWSKKLDPKSYAAATQQVVNGMTYRVREIFKTVLVPMKSGPMTIEPWKAVCQAEVTRRRQNVTGDPFFDDFFNSMQKEAIKIDVASNALSINVKPLPSESRPADFNGAVGTFSFQADLDKTRAKTNDAINLKLLVKGRGNLELIDKPEINFPPDFEVYDPKVVSNIQVSESGMSGSQVFEYLIIPRKAGTFSIKPISFSYYDLDKRKYITLSSDAYTIEVEKGDGDNTSSVTTYSGANKEDIKYIGSDIRHIHEGAIDLKPAGSVFFGSVFFWALYFLPLVFLMVFALIWRKVAVRRSNDVLMKNLRATRIAKKRLNRAEQYRRAGKQDEFYIEISQAVWGYLSDKFSIPMAELSKDSVQGALLEKNVDDALISRFIELLQNTEFARFAPGEKSDNMERIYQDALETISKMERELR